MLPGDELLEDRFLYNQKKQQRMPLLFLCSPDKGEIPALPMDELAGCRSEKGRTEIQAQR